MTNENTSMKLGLRTAGDVGAAGLVLLVALLPWQARYIFLPRYISGVFWEYGTTSLYMVDILLFIIATLAVVYAFQTKRVGTRQATFVGSAVVAYIVTARVLSPYEATTVVGGMGLLFAALMFFSVYVLPWKKRPMLYALVVGSVWSALFGAYQFFSGEVFGSTLLGIAQQVPGDLGVSVIEAAGARYLRAYGSLSHPNMLGGFLVVGIFSALMLLRDARVCWERWLLLFSMLFITHVLFLTFSRAALLGLAVGGIVTLVFVFFRNNTVERKILIGSFASILLVLLLQVVIFSDLVEARFSASRLEVQSLTDRTQSFEEAFGLLQDHPFIGVGYSAYTEALATRNAFDSPAWAYQPVHNGYFLLLVEVGIIGSVLLFYIIFHYFQKYWRGALTWEKQLYIGLLSALAVTILFDHYLISSHFGLLLLILVMSVSQNLKSTTFPNQEERHSVRS